MTGDLGTADDAGHGRSFFGALAPSRVLHASQVALATEARVPWRIAQCLDRSRRETSWRKPTIARDCRSVRRKRMVPT